ncbi:MAG: alanine racemase [Firmicutes bacterium]|nr:alanine racemase [Bacillota bacterium]
MLDHQRIMAEIDLDNIGHNMREIKKRVGDTKVLAVVKADAYGHGAVETAKVCLYNGADWLGVAMCDEGAKIRENNIHVPILILGYTPEAQIEEVIRYGLTQAVFSYETAVKISEAAKKINMTALVHIKIDTGMGRIGFFANDESIEEIMKISCLPNIKITGMFTHFATADEKDKTFTREQYEKFMFMKNELEKRGMNDIICHCANSGAIIDMPELNVDMVRAGIIIYGMYPSEDVRKDILELKPAMSLKTHISYIKEVEEGTSIGYGRTFFTKRKSRIATIPVGYADGYSRLMSNRGRVLINGKYADVVGNVCMDQIMADITDIDGVNVNDEVVLMGKMGDNEISAEELAQLQGTINYEIVCNVGKRIPRVYIRNGEILRMISNL